MSAGGNGLVYLASPYSDPDPAVEAGRFRAACRRAARMTEEGLLVFSPIAHSHPICVLGGCAADFAAWERFDRAMLDCCQRMAVLTLPGWEQSRGVTAEVGIAGAMGLDIEYLDPTPEELWEASGVFIGET